MCQRLRQNFEILHRQRVKDKSTKQYYFVLLLKYWSFWHNFLLSIAFLITIIHNNEKIFVLFHWMKNKSFAKIVITKKKAFPKNIVLNSKHISFICFNTLFSMKCKWFLSQKDGWIVLAFLSLTCRPTNFFRKYLNVKEPASCWSSFDFLFLQWKSVWNWMQ